VSTLLLDPTTWDLMLDANGNIALATEPYSTAQDIASACRLFLGELWYDTTKGVPYWQDILGQSPNAGLIKLRLQEAALTVPGVATAQVSVTFDEATRTIGGVIEATTTVGAVVVVGVPVTGGPFTVAISAIGSTDYIPPPRSR
jgi:hypothetical protein